MTAPRTLKDYRPQHDEGCIGGCCTLCGLRHRPPLPAPHADSFACSCGLDALLSQETPKQGGWLLEGQIAGQPVYWHGWTGGHGDIITYDASKAIRFARKVDAEKAIPFVLGNVTVTAVEHMWVPVTPEPPPQEDSHGKVAHQGHVLLKGSEPALPPTPASEAQPTTAPLSDVLGRPEIGQAPAQLMTAIIRAWHALRVEEVRVWGNVRIYHSGRCGAQTNALMSACENLALYMSKEPMNCGNKPPASEARSTTEAASPSEVAQLAIADRLPGREATTGV